MRAYRIAGPHRESMPLLLDLYDEAAVAHWRQDSTALSGWVEAHRRMVAENTMIRRSLALFVEALLIGIFLTACGGEPAGESGETNLTEQVDIASLQGVSSNGQSLFQSTCVAYIRTLSE